MYGAATLHWNRITFWHNSFSLGRTLIVDQERAHKRHSCRTPANIQAVRTLLDTDCRMTVQAIARSTNLPKTGVHHILHKDLKLMKKAARFVPKLLTPHHLRDRYETSMMILTTLRTDPDFLKYVVTMDESWVYTYDPEMKIQSSEWLASNNPRPVKELHGRTIGKSMLVTFFDWKGLIHHEFVRNRTIDCPLFIQILSRLREAMKTKRPRIRMLLHMDNASPHIARDTRLYLLLTGQHTLSHPAYSPDLAPNNFWYYPRLKKHLKGQRFPSLDALEEAVEDQIVQILSHEYEQCILKSWPHCFARCMDKDGDYFEGLG